MNWSTAWAVLMVALFTLLLVTSFVTEPPA